MNIFDIHSHLLPGVDDGANNLEVSLQMAKQAVANHVSKIIVTPHFSFKYQCLCDLMALKQVYCDFKEQVDINEIPLTIYFGLEILYSDELLDYLKDKKIKGINDTNYLLIEFEFDVSGEALISALAKIKAYGYNPILAHPERYFTIWNNFEILECLVFENIYFQCNAASLTGKFGSHAKKTMEIMLNYGYVSFIASDCHDLMVRNFDVFMIYHYVVDLYGEKYADELFYRNAISFFRGDN